MSTVQELSQTWQKRIAEECPNQSETNQASILCWLLAEYPATWETLAFNQQKVIQQGMDFTLRILCQRYLGRSPEQAYRNLLQRLSSLVLLRQKVQSWIATSRDRQRTVIDVLQEVLQEMLNSDRYLRKRMAQIAECTNDQRLRQSLTLASVEEYCVRPIRSQPLLVYRFVNYLRRSQRGGLTQVPQQEWVQLLSEELDLNDSDETVSLFDSQSASQYQELEKENERRELRTLVKEEFSQYLQDKVDPEAAEWLNLYLNGYTQEAIAKILNMPIKKVYRLREKVGYHAIKVFATRQKPELVASWLESSLNQHNFGLTTSQWQTYWQQITPAQKQLIEQMKAGKTNEAIAKDMKMKLTQVLNEWTQLYLTAQSIRNGDNVAETNE